MTKYANYMVIMDMASAKCDVYGPKKKNFFGNFELENYKTQNKFCQKRIDPLYIGLVNGFYLKRKERFD